MATAIYLESGDLSFWDLYREVWLAEGAEILKEFAGKDLPRISVMPLKRLMSLGMLPVRLGRLSKSIYRHVSGDEAKELGPFFDFCRHPVSKLKFAAREAQKVGSRVTVGMSEAERTAFYTLCAVSLVTGAWAGNATPDTDWKLLGQHRSGYTHSVVPAMAVASVGALFLRSLARCQKKIRRGSGAEKTALWLGAAARTTVSAFSMGVAFHTLADGTWENSQAVKFGFEHNTIIPGTCLDDDAFLVAQAFLCALFSKDMLKFSKPVG